MSASREKKQRQSAGPDQKALRAQQEQAARRKKTIAYSIVGAVAAVLVIALLVWRTGFFQARSTAATIGSEKLTAAQLGYYYYGGIRSTYAQYGLIDASKADDEQIYNAESGQTFRGFFMEDALNNAQKYFALEAEALNAGHTESEIKDDLATAISNAKSAAASSGLSYAAYLRAMYGSYMTTAVFEREVARILMANLVSGEKYNELYDGYTQADLEGYYKENADTLDTIEYSYLYFAAATVETKDADGNELPEDEVQKLKDNAKAEAKGKAEEALAAVKGGSSFESQADKYELSASNHSDHAKVVGTSSVGSAYREDLLKLGKGEYGLVEVDGGYYVISFHDRYLADEPTRDVRHILIRAETTTDANGNVVAPTEEAWAAAKAKMDEIQAAWDAGDKTEDAFASLANEKSEDGGSNTNGGLYPRVGRSDGYAAEFAEWVFTDGRKAGDTGVVQHTAGDSDYNKYWGYHFIYMVGDNEPVWMRTSRDALANADQTEWTDSLTASYPVTELSGANYFGK